MAEARQTLESSLPSLFVANWLLMVVDADLQQRLSVRPPLELNA
jgi:hypothetical protein